MTIKCDIFVFVMENMIHVAYHICMHYDIIPKINIYSSTLIYSLTTQTHRIPPYPNIPITNPNIPNPTLS